MCTGMQLDAGDRREERRRQEALDDLANRAAQGEECETPRRQRQRQRMRNDLITLAVTILLFWGLTKIAPWLTAPPP